MSCSAAANSRSIVLWKAEVELGECQAGFTECPTTLDKGILLLAVFEFHLNTPIVSFLLGHLRTLVWSTCISFKCWCCDVSLMAAVYCTVRSMWYVSRDVPPALNIKQNVHTQNAENQQKHRHSKPMGPNKKNRSNTLTRHKAKHNTPPKQKCQRGNGPNMFKT